VVVTLLEELLLVTVEELSVFPEALFPPVFDDGFIVVLTVVLFVWFTVVELLHSTSSEF